MNGGRADELPGTWSATLEWLVRRLAPSLPGLGFVEVKYRIRSWRRLDACVEDALAALAAVPASARVALVGFSMGGAVATRVAGDPRVEAVVGIAPWLPDRLDVAPLAGRRLAVVHGSLDRALPGVPGVSPALSRRGFQRALAAGAAGEYTLVRGGLHAVAIRTPFGIARLPKARVFARCVERELSRFSAGPGGGNP